MTFTLQQQYLPKLLTLIGQLPDEKVVEIFDFVTFLSERYATDIDCADNASLLLQQQALAGIWASPEEDLYELSPR